MYDVQIACCLPNGLTLEVGTPGGTNYQYFNLKGAKAPKTSTTTFPDRKGVTFGLTMIPAYVWNVWLAKNKTLRYVLDKSVFVVS
jgi:hypothetical protein